MFNYHIFNNKTKIKVNFEGDLDIEATELIEQQLTAELIQFQDKDIQFDFTWVLFVDSSGIGLLISMIDRLREIGCKVIIVNLDPEVKKVFLLLQLPMILGEDVFIDF